MPSSTTYRILIIHSNADATFSQRLAEALGQASSGLLEVWQSSLHEREDDTAAWEEARRNLQACDACVVVLSPSAMASTWVNAEVDYAWQLRRNGQKVILPVVYRETPMREDLAMIQTVSFLPPKSFYDAARETSQTLHQLLEPPTIPTPTPEAISPASAAGPARPKRGAPRLTLTPMQKRLAGIVSAAIGLLLVAFFGSLGLSRQREFVAQANATASVISTKKTFGVYQTVVANMDATSTAIAPYLGVTATAQAAQASATAQAAILLPYSSVNLACANDSKWEYDQTSTTCTSANATATFGSACGSYCSSALQFRYIGGSTHEVVVKHDMHVTISNVHGKVLVTMGTPLSSFGIDHNGNWTSYITKGGSSYQSGQGYYALPASFTLRNVFNGTTDSYYLDGKLMVSVKQSSSFAFMSYALTDVESINTTGPYSGSATFSDFAFTPLS